MKKLKNLFVRIFCIAIILTLLPISAISVGADANINPYAFDEEEMMACIY